LLDLVEGTVTCPYCWETLQVLLDPEEAGQSYIEDCQVCCHPMQVCLSMDGQGRLEASAERCDD
jgi:hypothetical protein